jgi:glycosyltransferase involved in cell wall biosynthesis
VSVIMPVYNCQSYINEAIESILNQTFNNFELLLIDDHSNDGTLESIRSYTDPRIVIIEKQQKTGLVASLNQGISLAKGKYIARMDGDDISLPTRMQTQVDFFEQHPDVAICGTAYQVIGTGEKVSYSTQHDDIKIALLQYCPIGHPTVMLRTDFLRQHNLFYDERFEAAEDYELWTRAIWLGQIVNIPNVLLNYRSYAQQHSNSNKNNQVNNSRLSQIKMLAKVWDTASDTDPCTRELLFGDQFFTSPFNLRAVVEWMQNLKDLNARKKCFDAAKFATYIDFKKRETVRRYYLNQVKYSPRVIFHFIQSYPIYRGCLSIGENLKLGVKCLLFWR